MVHPAAPNQERRASNGWCGYLSHGSHQRRCRMTAGGAPIAVHTLDEAATILRVKPSWLERQAAARKIPFTMLGGCYRFTAEHLAAIVRQYEQQPVTASIDESPRTATRQATPTQLLNDIKVKPLRPRPRRAA